MFMLHEETLKLGFFQRQIKRLGLVTNFSEDNEEPPMGYIRPLMVVVVDNRVFDYE